MTKIRAIQVPSDIVNQEGNCIVIQMSSHRRELIQRFVLINFPDARVSFSSESIQREPCSISVSKIKNISRKEGDIHLSQFPSAGVQIASAKGEDTMHIQTLKDFELTVDLDTIKGSCRHITPNRYEITLEVRKDPKPLVPAELPPGTIVVVNTPPPDQETLYLKTQLQLSRGEKIEIGEVVRALRQKDHSANSQPALGAETKSQGQTEKVFLSLQ